MAEREELQKRYAYSEMSSKVIQAERSRSRREPTGEVESLRGRADIGRMGDRMFHKKPGPPPVPPAKKKQKLSVRQDLAVTGETILELGNLNSYQPTTDQAKAAYERILGLLGSNEFLGSQSPQILRGAAEEVILVLKNQKLRDPERKKALGELLLGKESGLSLMHFTNFVQLGKQLDDYEKDDTRAEDVDEMGVAVVFDESEGERSEESDEKVVVDASSDSSEEEPDDAAEQSDVDVVVQGVDEAKKRAKSRVDRVLSVHEIDAHFLQRELAKQIDDADGTVRLGNEILKLIDIRTKIDLRECENRLLAMLGIGMFDLIKLVLRNRVRIWACVSIKRAKADAERVHIEEALQHEESGEGRRVLEELHSQNKAEDWSRDRLKGAAASIKRETEGVSQTAESQGELNSSRMEVDEPVELDLDALAFPDGAHTMSNVVCELPATSWRSTKQGYEEVHVPAIRSGMPKDEKLVAISELPSWTQAAFKGMDKLNRIQSKMCDAALRSSDNLLLCAPTGAGKTNVACLTMLNILGQYRREANGDSDDENELASTGAFDLQSFKIVYIAPMKALVQEVVKNFSERLKDYGVAVRELSGDSSLTRQQIAETHMLVTTPEKWDVVTRQGEGRAYTQLVKLVIVDEIHLLHDERGPVLESIVARVIRQVETSAEPVRLVGLSATLPNYADVATFLRVTPENTFFFDSSFRPVPLQMQYIGISERNAFKRFQLQNEICYEKAMDQRRNSNQVLIFVHSRAETGKTAKALRDLAQARDELSFFVRDGSATQEILREEAASAKNEHLKEVLQYGFATHHAGMVREDRELVEDLFADRHIAVLISTATLAWGVNLPCHCVIIRGTQIYDPAKGRWTELSPLDVLQMLGRAGRPQYDAEGEGIILTQHDKLQYYLSLTSVQLPVESQLVKSLPDHLNSEIVLGSIQTLDEAVDWLSYTFLYVRMLRNPALYGIGEAEFTSNPKLTRRRLDLAHTAASLLEKSHLVRYDRRSGTLTATSLGRVASQFYITHLSMATYVRHMRPGMSDIEVLRLFSMSGEFAHVTVREEEVLEIEKLTGRVPIPVKEGSKDRLCKVNVLLQAYISRLKLDGFALMADMAFIHQSAARIMRALFEIALRRRWAALARSCLDFANSVSYRMWRSQSPLRQFRVHEAVARKLERNMDIDWDRYYDLAPTDLGELVGAPKMGRVLHKLVQQFPRVQLSAQIQPITRSLLRIELTVVPAFQFEVAVHGFVQLFHILVEDVNGETILHHETLSLKSTSSDELVTFTVPIWDPLPPAYYIRVVSDKFLHCAFTLPVMLSTMILPAKFPPPTEVLDLQPLLPSALGDLGKLFPFKSFNAVQTQAFHELFKTDRNCLVCAPSCAGKLVLAEIAILRMLVSDSDGKCVYVAPTDDISTPVYAKWTRLFGAVLPRGSIVQLTGEVSTDMLLLADCKIAIASVKSWDILSRRWRQRKPVQAVTLIVFDEIHLLGGETGPTFEVIVTRTRYMSAQMEVSKVPRILALSASLANANSVGDWLGVPPESQFNFPPSARPSPLEIKIESFEENNFAARLMAMAKPVYNAVAGDLFGNDRTAIVFVPSRRQAQLTAIDLMTYHEARANRSFLADAVRDTSEITVGLKDSGLKQVLASGIGYLHDGMIRTEHEAVVDCFQHGQVRVLVVASELCWKVEVRAHHVVIMGTESYDGRESRYVDYSVPDVLHMIGRHEPESNCKCSIFCHAPKKEYWKKVLFDPLPIESHLDSYLHDPLNAEIVSRTVSSMQDAIDYITWTFFYRRLTKNPTYYGLQATSNIAVSEHLSALTESIIGDLEESKCCQMSDNGDLQPLNLGMIAAYYDVQYRTVELIASSVTEKTKVRGILEIIAASWEFSGLAMRYGEEKLLRSLARALVHKLPEEATYNSNAKALILLQCHFSRKALPADMRIDQAFVVAHCTTLVQACVDVISSNGWLKPALAAMELSQMVVQGLWNRDNILKQIPHFTDEVIKRCEEAEEPIESVFDILSLDDDARNSILQLSDDKMADVAIFCNNYPSVDVRFHVQDSDSISAGAPVQVTVDLEREVEEDEVNADDLARLGTVAAPLYPKEKKETWWIVIGDKASNGLLALKRVDLRQRQSLTLDFLAPEEAGDYDLTLFCMSDSYLGCDQEYALPLSVSAPEEDSDDSGNDE